MNKTTPSSSPETPRSGATITTAEKIDGIVWLRPIRTFAFWVIHLSTVTTVAVVEHEPWFAPWHLWAWPIVFGSLPVAYIVAPPVERIVTNLFRSRRQS